MKKRFARLAFCLFLLGALPAAAQTMSDSQVLEYVKQGMQQGKDQKQIAMELARRGVTEEQARRVQEMYQQQSKGTLGTSSSTSQDRMRQSSSGTSDYYYQNGYRKNTNRNAELQQERREQMEQEYRQRKKMEEERKKNEFSQRDLSNNPYSMEYNMNTNQNRVVSILGDSLSLSPFYEYDPEDQVFGRDIFNTENLTFEPNMNLATPSDYRLGPGDEVIIDIWGASQNTIRETISPDGYINIPDLGLVLLNGMSVSEAKTVLKQELSKIYANSGNNIQVSLGNTRTIQINVMGEVLRPGTYTLSSFATVFHALYSAGGVSDIGSLRNIHVARNGKNVATVDVYEFIMQGKIQDDIRLQEGDVIIVPPYEAIVKITGKVKRPMRYEMKSDESIATLLKYAGNFAADGYKNSLRIIRQAGREYSVATVDAKDFTRFQMCDGDEVTADPILERFTNRLEVKGAVYRPGIYELSGSLNTVKQLVEKADGLLGDAFTNRAVLYRQRENLTSEVLSVDIKGILAGSSPDIALRNNDVLYIPSIHDLKDLGSIRIYGEVTLPGEYPYADNMTLEDIVITAGGLKESASLVRVDVSRRIRDPKSTTEAQTIGETYSFALKDGFVVDGEAGFVLQPYDQVFVRRSPGYSEQANVTVKGEVLYSGQYTLTSKNERLTDVIKKAGGVTQFGYVRGAKLTRIANEEEKKRMQDVLNMMQKELGAGMTDSLKLELDSIFTVGIDLEAALAKPGSNADIVLRKGDIITVPEFNNTVKLNGAVMIPNTVSYIDGKSVKYYLSQAGGYSSNAKKSKKFIIYMNGQVAEVKGSGKKQIEPGCEIVVPNKQRKNNLGNILGYATSFASLATMVASIANIVK